MLVAISGGAGFLGLHLSRRLVADGHAVRTLDVTPYVARFVERSLAGEALGAAVAGAARDSGLTPNDVLSALSLLLSDWAERGLLLGAVG